MKNYHYNHNGEVKQALGIEGLKQAGVTKKTQIWYEGLSDWQNAEDLQELTDLFKSTPPPLPTNNQPPPLSQSYSQPVQAQKSDIEYDSDIEKPNYLKFTLIAGTALLLIWFGYSYIQTSNEKEAHAKEAEVLKEVLGVKENKEKMLADSLENLNKEKQEVEQKQQQEKKKYDTEQKRVAAEKQAERVAEQAVILAQNEAETAAYNLKMQALENVKANIGRYIVVDDNYQYREIGGIFRPRITIYNKSQFPLRKATVKVDYIKADGGIYKTEYIRFRNVAARGNSVESAPESDRGIKLRSYLYDYTLGYE